MKAITICQPYAEMIANGEKRVENRVWFTNYRGPILIHAGKSRTWLDGETDAELEEEFGRKIEFGAVVAKAVLVDCVRIDRIESGEMDERYPFLKSRAHCGGPYCWVLTDVERLPEAIPWKGEQGLWECSGVSEG
jgi:hypothetical protein